MQGEERRSSMRRRAAGMLCVELAADGGWEAADESQYRVLAIP